MTIPLSLNGKIKKIDGRQEYACIFLDTNTVGISFNVANVKYKKGFNKYHIYAIGDTVLKKAYSKEVTIKNGDSICIFELECND